MDALEAARHLAEHGVPLFLAEPDPNGGHNDTGYHFPPGWQKTEPDPSVVDAWKPGMALCAVTGRMIDVIDLDPRNGGEPDAVPFPRTYGVQKTPSGGTHHLVATLGVASKDGVQPGVDVKAGEDDGGKGFVFIAPTVRASKVTGDPVRYEWVEEPNISLLLIGGDTTGNELRELIENGRRRTSEGLEYDGPSYSELPDHLKTQAEEYVADLIHDWRIRLAEAAAWPEGQRDAHGRGWEALARDSAWALASQAACPWSALTEEEAELVYREILPDEIANNAKCSHKWYDGLVDKAGAEPVRQPPWWAQVFFESTDRLQHIKQAAHSRGISSMSLLASILGRILLQVPPSVTLPPVVGGRASLNLGFALVGDSGTTKSSSDSVAEELIGKVSEDWLLPIGSGEGMIDAFLEPDMHLNEKGELKPTGQQKPVDDPHRMFTVDEGETLDRLMDRRGATGGSFMRTALTGGTLGTTNARAGGRNRRLAKDSYRLVMLADIHPEQSDVLLAGEGNGMPQRFVWMPARDKELPEEVEEMPEWPGPLDWTLPEQDIGDIEYPEHIQREVRQTRLDSNHGRISAKEAHNNLTRLKVAYALASLHEETSITDQWWRLAGRLTDASLRLQEECQSRLNEIRQKKATAKVVTEQRAMEEASEDRLGRAVDAIVERLKKNKGETLPWSKVKPAYRLIHDIPTEEIVRAAGKRKDVLVTQTTSKNDVTGWKFRYVKPVEQEETDDEDEDEDE